MVHIGQLIELELHRQERSVTWFANKLYCDRTNVYKIFKRGSIDSDLLLRISTILNHNSFFTTYRNSKTTRKKTHSHRIKSISEVILLLTNSLQICILYSHNILSISIK